MPAILERFGPKNRNNKKAVKDWKKQEKAKQQAINTAFKAASK